VIEAKVGSISTANRLTSAHDYSRNDITFLDAPSWRRFADVACDDVAHVSETGRFPEHPDHLGHFGPGIVRHHQAAAHLNHEYSS
jgi:hypothetical protein